jgi:hypothetical protein
MPKNPVGEKQFTAIYSIHGPHDLPVKKRLVNHKAAELREFWNRVEITEGEALSAAVGCYVFVIRKSKKAKPYYVGLAGKGFAEEVFEHHKVNHYNSAIGDEHPGQNNTPRPQLYFLVRRTTTGRLSKPSKTRKPKKDIAFLEKHLMALGLRANSELRNSANTRFLRSMRIQGMMNSLPGRTAKSAKSLKRALNI